jgi:hypothetical protein
MKSLINLIPLILIAFSCARAPIKTSTEVTVPEIVVTPDLPVETAPSLKVTVTQFLNHTPSELRRNKLAIDKIMETVEGFCFEEFMLNRGLIQTEGRSPMEVIEHIRSSDVKIRLRMYRNIFTTTAGYTYANTDLISLNRKYYDRMDECDAAANLGHEVTHKIGYGHDPKPNTRRPFSVPYSTGSAIEKCCKR